MHLFSFELCSYVCCIVLQLFFSSQTIASTLLQPVHFPVNVVVYLCLSRENFRLDHLNLVRIDNVVSLFSCISLKVKTIFRNNDGEKVDA